MKPPIRLILVSVFVPALVLASGCQTYERGDLTRYAVQHNFPVSTDASPPNTTPIGIVSMQEDGFYFLGMWPIIRVSLQGCLDRMVEEAKKDGAHGLADIEYEVNPAYMFKLTDIWLPDWTANVRITATAYRNLPTDPTNARTGRSTEPIHTAPAPAHK